MEKLNHLYTIMYRETWSIILIVIFVGLSSCKSDNNNHVETNAQVVGIVECMNQTWSQPNGVKVVLSNQSDNSIEHIAVTGSDGHFQFDDIEAGVYSIEAIKEGYEWIWMVDDDVVNHTNNIIQIVGGKTKEIKILLNRSSYESIMTFNLKITDMNGNPIESIHVPKYTTTVAFMLYNDTDMSHVWSLGSIDHCFVSDDRGFYLEYLFDNITPTSGTLEPGNNVVVIGTINQNIWNIYTNKPYYVSSSIGIYNGIASKSINLNIDF